MKIRDVVALAAMFVPAIAAYGPVFGGHVGYLAAAGGVLVGLGIAVIAARWKWSILTTLSVTVIMYLLFGGIFALPQISRNGIIPTLHTLQTLVVQAVEAWRDLLTLTPPANAFVGPSVLPYFVGTICSLIAGSFAFRSKHLLWAVLPSGVMFLVGIFWGLSKVNQPHWWGIAWIIVVLTWWAWRTQLARTQEGIEVLVGNQAQQLVDLENSVARRTATGSSGATTPRIAQRRWQIAGSLATLIVAGSLSFLVVPVWMQDTPRIVLRDYVVPPIDLQEYPSPLSYFRHYSRDLEDKEIFQVSGLPRGSRLRLAALDVYDGTVYGMNPEQIGNKGFQHIGRSVVPSDNKGTEAQINITVRDYSSVWIPLVGSLNTIEFAGSHPELQAKGLFYNFDLQTALTTAGFQNGDSYNFTTIIPPHWSDDQLAGFDLGTPLPLTPSTIPPSLQSLATETGAKSNEPLQQIRHIERFLSGEGFFSNGEDGLSRPGHRLDRIERLVTGEQMIGDDEQYAVTMALMLRSLGIPARVVMGFYSPEDDAQNEIALPVQIFRGQDIHAWVEVEFDQAGWVPFDPTPPRDQIPQTDVPKPRSESRPQVLQPPDPPEKPVELPPETVENPPEEHDKPAKSFPILFTAQILGSVLLLLAPIMIILAIKARRRGKRRKAKNPAKATAGSWDELVDTVIDMGVQIPEGLTRREAAALIETNFWSRSEIDAQMWQSQESLVLWHAASDKVRAPFQLANRADIAIFGGVICGPQEVALAWQEYRTAQRELLANVGRWRRFWRHLSLRSLRVRRKQARAKKRQLRKRQASEFLTIK